MFLDTARPFLADGYQSLLAYYPGADVSIAVGSNIETTYQSQPLDTMCDAYNALLPILTDAGTENCSYVDSGYYGVCYCGNSYKCVNNTCVEWYYGTLSKTDCETGCNVSTGIMEA